MILLFLGSWRSTVIIATSIRWPSWARSHCWRRWRDAQHHDRWAARARSRSASWWTMRRWRSRTSITSWSRARMSSPRSWIRRSADSDAGLRVTALHLHRVRADVLPDRRRALPVRADGTRRDVRDDMASFILSRTLVPTMANALLKPHTADSHGEARRPSRNPLGPVPAGLRGAVREVPCRLPRPAGDGARPARVFITGSTIFVVASFALAPFLGRNFFPSVDPGQILMHARVPIGTRVEEAANTFADIEKAIAQIIPARERGDDRRQHRHAGQRHQHHLQQHRLDREPRRRPPDQAS